MALLPRDQRHQYLRFEGLKYIDADIANFRKGWGRFTIEGCIEYKFLILEDLSPYWRGISSEGDLLGTALSYTAIRDLMLRMCHWLIACSNAGRSQALDKAWVAPEPKRRPDVAAGAIEVAEGALNVDEGA
uniref:Uncharacterized protein n=1 Tax=Tanacetum cinerariifolium TaxID=118510 RepID=A0A699I431_TANCI|nr:hypothetical protein [Tanacetum cinerariifolium]